MGLYVHSLENIPQTTNRDYFIYLLDYGWDEPISKVLRENFEEMAVRAAKDRAVVIKGTELSHFENEVFSWHQINGMRGEDILPALLIANKHPSYFQNESHGRKWGKNFFNESQQGEMKLILVPFKKFCTTSTEVISLIQKIFNDIGEGKDVADFSILSELKGGTGRAIVDAIILQPNIAGVGIDFKKLLSRFFG